MKKIFTICLFFSASLAWSQGGPPIANVTQCMTDANCQESGAATYMVCRYRIDLDPAANYCSNIGTSISLEAISYDQSAQTCTINNTAIPFAACQKMYFMTCQASGENCSVPVVWNGPAEISPYTEGQNPEGN